MIDIEKMLAEKKPLIDEVIREFFPKTLKHGGVEEICGPASFSAIDEKLASKAVNEICWDLLERGGKRWRPALYLIILEALGGKKAVALAKDFLVVPEVVHNGTLLVDDIEDDSLTRRGKPCVHKSYGVDLAVNAGNAMYFIPLNVFFKRKNDFPAETMTRAYEIFAQEMIKLSYGQGLDIYWHKGNAVADEKQYLQMCAYKTGALARMSARLAANFAGAGSDETEALGKYAEAIGVAFQIQDDVLNLEGEEEKYGKEIGGDISEGKQTLITIHALKHLTPAKATRLQEILSSHSKEERVIREAIALIKETHALDYAKKFSRKLVQDAWTNVEGILKESKAKHELKAFADYLVERKL